VTKNFEIKNYYTATTITTKQLSVGELKSRVNMADEMRYSYRTKTS